MPRIWSSRFFRWAWRRPILVGLFRCRLWQIGIATLVLAAITAVSLASWRKRPWLLVGWLWYLGMLVPVIGFVQFGAQAEADRFTYLPQIGLAIGVVWAAADAFGSGPRLRPLAAAVVPPALW